MLIMTSLHVLIVALLIAPSFTAAAAAADTTSNEQIFSVSYSTPDDDTTCSGSAVSVMGYLPNEIYPNTTKVFIGTTTTNETDSSSMTCGEQAICLVDSESDLCTGTTLVSPGLYEEDGEIYWIEGDDKSSVGPGKCIPGYWTPACHIDSVTLSELKNDPEEYFGNTNPDDRDQLKPFVYTAYYSNDDCTDLTAIITEVLGEVIVMPELLDDDTESTISSCHDATLCAIYPNSTACKDLNVSFTMSTAPFLYYAVYGDDGSSVNLIGEDYDQNISATACYASTYLPNCYFRPLSGIYLAEHPKAIIGDFGDENNDNGVNDNNGDQSGNDNSDGGDDSGGSVSSGDSDSSANENGSASEDDNDSGSVDESASSSSSSSNNNDGGVMTDGLPPPSVVKSEESSAATFMVGSLPCFVNVNNNFVMTVISIISITIISSINVYLLV